ncbi:MAG: M1 family aminopeptidase [Bacteroidota bacterium]
MKPKPIFLALLITTLLLSCGTDSENLTEPGVSLQLAEHRVASIKDVIYTLDISIPEAYDSAIYGVETVSFKLTDLTQPLVFDFKVPKEYLKDVWVNEQSSEYKFENEHIIIDKEALEIGTNTVKFEFRTGETSLNRNQEYLYTLFVPDRARTAFPCFDQPNIKAKYNLTLTIPAQWQAIANGAARQEKIENNQKTITFAETKPISTYLFDFVAGDFQVISRDVNGRMMTMLHRETDSLKVENNVDAIFELHGTALDWLEDYTGIEYPFQKFGFAIIPSFQYGGMEHPGAITYKGASLFLDESATQNQLLRRASLIAHETAHMWFGDLVTMDWFSDVWMKEVFANFMAAKIVHPSFPEINHDLRFLLAHYPASYSVDRTLGTHPIQQPLDNLKDAGSLYGSIIYQKAPIVMRMLERKIGKEEMQKGLKQYLSEFEYGNATWDDLIAILDSASDKSITDWSNQWVKTAGMPQIFPYLKTKKDSTIKQLGVFQRSKQEGDKYWSQSLSVMLEAEDSMYYFDVDVEGNMINIDEAEGLRKTTFILCNSKGYGYGYFRLGNLTKKRLMEHMQEFEDPVLRGVGWLNLWENLLVGSVEPKELLAAILANLKTEPDPLLQQHLLSQLSSLFWKFLSPEDRLKVSNKIESTLWDQIESMDDSRLKSAYFSTYRSVALTDEGVSRLYALWNKSLSVEGLSLSENDFTQLAHQLALREYEDYETILNQQIEQIANPDRKVRMLFILPALSANQETRDVFFESLKDVNNREQESWVQEAIGFLHHPLRAEQSRKYITPTLEMLEEIQQTGDIFFPKRVLDNTFRGHQSPEAVNDVRQFLYRNNHYPGNLKNKILQASDLTFRAAEILEEKEEQ